MSESNYDILRNQMPLESWDGVTQKTVPPSNDQILKLLDALNADIKGEVLPEVEEVRAERWWNS